MAFKKAEKILSRIHLNPTKIYSNEKLIYFNNGTSKKKLYSYIGVRKIYHGKRNRNKKIVE